MCHDGLTRSEFASIMMQTSGEHLARSRFVYTVIVLGGDTTRGIGMPEGNVHISDG